MRPGPRVLRGGAVIAAVCAAAGGTGALALDGAFQPARAARPARPATAAIPARPARPARAGSGRRATATAAVDYTKHAVRSSGKRYGYVPAWLGHQSVPVGRIVTAAPGHPWLAVQGDTVRLKLPHAQLLATVVGPAVPTEGRFPVPRSTRCSFTVTLTDASAPLSIRPAEFSAIDEQGRLHTLRVSDARGGRPAAEIRPGQTVRLTLRAVLPVGQGDIQWAPVAGVRPIVRWDFDVEID